VRSGEPERRAGYAFAAPAVLLLVIVALVPVALAIALSFERRILVFHEARFVGLDNYAFLLRDARFWSALGHTAYFALVAVSLEMALGLAFAVLLDAAVRGRGLLRAAVLIPWAIPTVVSAKLWAWLFDADHGLVRRLLPLRDVDLLGAPGWAMHAAIVVDVWKTTPFVALLLLAGLQTIPGDVRRAAAIDGASAWRTFRSITLPLLRPTLLVALVFRTLDAFRVFDAVYVLTGGGPANTTETLSIYAYKTMMRAGDFGYGATLSVATFLAVMILAAGYMKLLGDREAAR
jgi:multiple sugar transport system permease protein